MGFVTVLATKPIPIIEQIVGSTWVAGSLWTDATRSGQIGS